MIDEVDEPADWVIACQREAAIRDLLKRHPKRLSISAVDDVAGQLGLSRASLYRLIARFRVVSTADGLASLSRGRRAGTQMLDTEKEKLIQTILEREYLKPTRPPLQPVIEQIRGACLERGWRPPTWRTVKARLSLIDARKRACACQNCSRSHDRAQNRPETPILREIQTKIRPYSRPDPCSGRHAQARHA